LQKSSFHKSDVTPLGHAIPPTPEQVPPKRSKENYLWAVLMARIYEVFPLLCPLCGGQMRLIANIPEGTQIRHCAAATAQTAQVKGFRITKPMSYLPVCG